MIAPKVYNAGFSVPPDCILTAARLEPVRAHNATPRREWTIADVRAECLAHQLQAVVYNPETSRRVGRMASDGTYTRDAQRVTRRSQAVSR